MLLLEHVQRDIRMQPQRYGFLLSLSGHTLDRPLNSTDDGFGCEDTPRAITDLARFGHALVVTLTHALPRHLNQSEVADGKGFRARAITSEVLPELLQHAIAIGLRFHVDKIAHDDAADIAQPELTCDFTRGFGIRFENRFFRIALARVSPGVHVNRNQCFRGLDDEVSA